MSAADTSPSSEIALARTASRPVADAPVSAFAGVPIAAAIAALSAKVSPGPPVPK